MLKYIGTLKQIDIAKKRVFNKTEKFQMLGKIEHCTHAYNIKNRELRKAIS